MIEDILYPVCEEEDDGFVSDLIALGMIDD